MSGNGRITRLAAAVAMVAALATGSHAANTGGGDHAQHANHAPQAGFERLDVNERAAPFALVNQNGKRVALCDFRGKAIVMTFLYTSCTDVCPLLVHTAVTVDSKLTAEERKRVRFVAVTVDPVRDTPAKLKAFMKSRGLDESRWQLLTGDVAGVTRAIADYGVLVRPAPRGDFVHNSVFIVIDAAGVERTEFHGVATPPSAIVEAVRMVLREPLATRPGG
jgi:protein SCO1/2